MRWNAFGLHPAETLSDYQRGVDSLLFVIEIERPHVDPVRRPLADGRVVDGAKHGQHQWGYFMVHAFLRHGENLSWLKGTDITPNSSGPLPRSRLAGDPVAGSV